MGDRQVHLPDHRGVATDHAPAHGNHTRPRPAGYQSPMLQPARPPFEGHPVVYALVPSPDLAETDEEAAVLERLPLQLTSESSALARELGAPVEVVTTLPEQGATWLIGPARSNPALAALELETGSSPTLHLDRERARLVSDAPDLLGVLQTFTGLRSLARHPGGPLRVDHCTTIDEAIERVLVEVHDSWAGFELRDVDWIALSRQHVWQVRGATNSIAAMQRWLTPLGDFHTWVRPVGTQLVLPYGATIIDGELVFTHVLPWTRGYELGLRPGHRLVGADVAGTWATTPSAPHARALAVARRLLSGDAGHPVQLEARGPGGHWLHWEETPQPPTGTPASWTVLEDGTGFLWVGAWVPGLGVEETIAEAFEALADRPRLIVDLRGNGGGRLAMAEAFRARFLDRPTTVGWIRHTRPGGGLGPPEPLTAEPLDGPRWTRPVRFLTSPLSYSSTEDALLGLQGLEHVQVWGERSGGGSGRNRRMKLLPGWRLTISTALTYDRHGRCIEGSGIEVDHPVVPDRRHPTGDDPVMRAAETTPW